MQDISEIRKLRKSLDMTQKDLAKKAGVSQSLIAKAEAGAIDPTYSNVQKIFNALNNFAKKDDIKVKDIINRNIISILPSAKISEAIILMKKHEISQLPVISNHPVGLVTEGLLLENLSTLPHSDIQKLTVREIMADCPPMLSIDCPIEAVTDLLKHYPMILIRSDEKICGLITKFDVLSALAKK